MHLSVDTDVLFASATAVWNRALDVHRDEFPYKQILAACEKLTRNEHLSIDVYDRDSDEPIAQFAVRFRHGHVEPMALGARPERAPWKVTADYLKKVVESPTAFIRNPMRLDWEWTEREGRLR